MAHPPTHPDKPLIHQISCRITQDCSTLLQAAHTLYQTNNGEIFWHALCAWRHTLPTAHRQAFDQLVAAFRQKPFPPPPTARHPPLKLKRPYRALLGGLTETPPAELAPPKPKRRRGRKPRE